MKLEVKNGSENYAATVVKISNLHDIEGADRIQRTVVFGNNVIISKEAKVGDTMIYFVSGTKLNSDFCKYNDLLTDAEQNKNKKAGYISHKQFRVKAIKLKGIISDGILLPLVSLSYILNPSDGYYYDYQDVLKEGDTFTDIDGVSICEKYIVPSARNSNPGGKAPKQPSRISRLVDKQFQQYHIIKKRITDRFKNIL